MGKTASETSLERLVVSEREEKMEKALKILQEKLNCLEKEREKLAGELSATIVEKNKVKRMEEERRKKEEERLKREELGGSEKEEGESERGILEKIKALQDENADLRYFLARKTFLKVKVTLNSPFILRIFSMHSSHKVTTHSSHIPLHIHHIIHRMIQHIVTTYFSI